MLRLPLARARAVQSSLLYTAALARHSSRPQVISQVLRPIVAQRHQTTTANAAGGTSSGHAVSNPTLANIEKRWEQMPPEEQAELWMALRDRMVVDWHELTTQEKKAAYWIAFGPHGPRKQPPPGEKWEVFKLTSYTLIVCLLIFFLTRHFAGPPPKTMNREWQEATNEWMKENRIEPITGAGAEGYKGKGMIQDPYFGLGKAPKPLEEEEED